MSKKSAYVTYSEDEVRDMENSYFCINMDGEFVKFDDFYFFTKREAVKVYKNTFKNLVKLANDGTAKERKYALDLMFKTVIQPVRFH